MIRGLITSIKSVIGNRNPLRLFWHRCKALTAAARYGFPGRKLTIIGITGTDGKTTTVAMTAHILYDAGVAVGALSTAFVRVKNQIQENPSQKTSPSPFVIQKFLRRLVSEGCTHAVLEYSSHGLVQGRLNHTYPAVAGITNTAAEHLDYHGSMEQYRKDKGILFEMLRGRGTKVLNADDGTFEMYADIPSHRTLIYGIKKPAAFHLTDVTVSVNASAARLHVNKDVFPLQLNIPGAFNLENALCAIACAQAVSVSVRNAVESLETFRSVAGRMERIDEGQPYSVFVDFTVTPQAFERTLGTLRNMIEPGKRILVLTGACGRRMVEKRPVIGKMCSDLADVVVITDDEPYDEDPEKIMNEIWAGIDQSATEAYKVLDRREAIALIFSKAKPGDAVILCGLGSYPTRQMKDRVIAWNEQEIARELLHSIQ